MKLRVETGFKPLMNCKAYGTTYGNRWWVISKLTRTHEGVTMLVQPGADMLVTLSYDRYLYTGRHGGNEKSVVLDPVYILWAVLGVEPHGAYADMMRHAVYFEVATMLAGFNPAAPTGAYIMDTPFLPKKTRVGTYDKWLKKIRLTEEEAIACTAYVAERVCESMFNAAKARRESVRR